MNAADTTCGNPRGTLLSQAAMPLTFAVRPERAGGTDSKPRTAGRHGRSRRGTELPTEPSLIPGAVLGRYTS
jgi:hypothetical protein